jgi:hypothetical protein
MSSLSGSGRPARVGRASRAARFAAAAATPLGLAFALATAQSGPALAATGPAAAAVGAQARQAARQAPAQGLALRPATGKGCHTYDLWNGYDICIEVWGSGLNVQQVEGWVDGRGGAADLVHLYTTDGDLSTEEYLDGSGQAWFSWSVGGGIWLTNYQNICFTDVTINQSACIYLDAS